MTLAVRFKKTLRALGLNVQKPFCEDVLVLGDSHAAVFNHPAMRARLWRYRLDVISVGGATASGLENPNSKTQAYQKFDGALSTTRAKKVIVMLGEVDTGFVIWYRAAKYGVPVAEALAKTLATYEGFLRSLSARGFTPICISTPLPTIGDGNRWGEVANARSSVTATQRERTALTLEFNHRMARFCHLEGIAHLNLDALSLGADGLVKAELLNKRASDHHYEKRVFATLLSQPVRRTVQQAPLTRSSWGRTGRAAPPGAARPPRGS
jgi:hypothetical protein